MALTTIEFENDVRWDEFVDNHPRGSIYHHSEWGNVLRSTFGYVPFYLAAESPAGGGFEGILPLMLVNSRLTGRRLVSLPITSYCARMMPASELENIVRFSLERHPCLDYLEFKFCEEIDGCQCMLECQQGFVTHVLDLDSSLDELFRSFHSTSVRQRISRAEKYNLRLKFAEREEDLGKYYGLHAKVRKKHGLPPHPYSFFLNMWNILEPRNYLSVPLVEYHGKVIAGAFVLKFKDTFTLEYSASDHRYLNACPNQFLIWEIIKNAHGEGAKHFDFGRSSLSHGSLVEFKERWGARKQPLMYYYYPKADAFNTEGAMRRMLCLVNRFLPVPLLRIEGEMLYRHLG